MSLKIYFGPYETHGVIRHKTQKLSGILTKLTALGYEIELIPTDRLNTLIIHFRDKEVYRCDIRYFKFNMSFEDDPVAQMLVSNLQETIERFDDDDNIPKFSTKTQLVGGAAQDYLSDSVDLLYEIPAKFEELIRTHSKGVGSVSTTGTMEGSIHVVLPAKK